MPVWETPEPVPTPSGDVAAMVGVGLAIPLTCALASLQTTSTASIAVISENFIGVFRFVEPSCWLERAWIILREKSAAADVQFLIQRLVSLLLFCVESR
jgi:hypothetical protein